MKILTAIVIATSLLSLLTSCTSTTNPPDVNSLQPTQHQVQQEKMQQALHS